MQFSTGSFVPALLNLIRAAVLHACKLQGNVAHTI